MILLLLITANSKSQNKTHDNEINVLFIGNSLTYYHDMPQKVQMMVNETNPNINIEQITFPGMSLYGHINEIITDETENLIETRKKKEGELTPTEKKIIEKKWDYIILQTGTIRLLIPEVRDFKINKAITSIKEMVTNPACKFILFNTWSSKGSFPKEYCYTSLLIDPSITKNECCSPTINSLKEECELINHCYDLVAKKNNILKSDNGSKFYKVLTKYPKIDLYDDDYHPSDLGSFLNACIFYQMLTNKKATKLKYNGEIEPKTAKLLKKIAR